MTGSEPVREGSNPSWAALARWPDGFRKPTYNRSPLIGDSNLVRFQERA